jgi:hypothetical protein
VHSVVTWNADAERRCEQAGKSRRRVLIVSPHFPPINAPDHQRVRMSLPHFEEFGWEPTVLTVSPEYVEGEPDPLLLQTVPETTPVFRAKAIPVKYTRRVGLGSLALRSLPYLRRQGDKILRGNNFDLVYFSTTMFPVMALGPRWKKLWDVPYVLDFQDPWLGDYFNGRDDTPPGGHFKYGMSQRIAKLLEPYALKHASHVISVSPAYPQTLLKRYRWLREDSFTVLPFGASSLDFDLLLSLKVRQRQFNPNDRKRHWVYVGAGGSAMAFSASSLFQALRRARTKDPTRWNDLVLHFIGTDYAPRGRGRKSFEPLAAEFGIADMVQETSHRIPYLEALKCMLDADALIVPGSDDPGYTPSKLYPYILAGKPLLVIVHEESSAVNVIEATKAGTLVTFRTGESVADVSERIEAGWLNSNRPTPTTNWNAFSAYTAREMTRRQCAVFDESVRETKTSSRGQAWDRDMEGKSLTV